MKEKRCKIEERIVEILVLCSSSYFLDSIILGI
jgi:hypothetical protein